VRKDEPGYEEIACPDGRRGLWIRSTEDEQGLLLRLEFAAGREGDDDYLELQEGERLTRQKLHELRDVMHRLRYAHEVTVENAYYRTFKGRLRILPVMLRHAWADFWRKRKMRRQE
jgi:hypothetical protein